MEAFIIISVLQNILFTGSKDQQSEVCLTEDCVRTGNVIKDLHMTIFITSSL